MGRDSPVDIATRYGLDGSGFESRWGARFSTIVQTGPGDRPDSYTIGTESFPGVKRPGRDVDHPPQSSAEVKVKAELHPYSTSGPSCTFCCEFTIEHVNYINFGNRNNFTSIIFAIDSKGNCISSL